MQQIKIVDTQFAHAPSFGCGDLNIKPTYFEWYRGTENINDVVVVTESCFHLVHTLKEKIKIALILEPYSINAAYYISMLTSTEFRNQFTYILTHRKNDTTAGIGVFDNKISWYPFGGCWIKEEDRLFHKKTKDVSIIASHKKETDGHKLRHSVIEHLGKKIDVFGNGYNYIKNKITALKDYRFSVIIENDKHDLFFTEKLIDCFVTGTIPIYYGCNDIVELFNPGGMICVNNLQQIANVIDVVDKNLYREMLPALQQNVSIASQYIMPENWLWNNFFKNILG